jgi:hypothetical protein
LRFEHDGPIDRQGFALADQPPDRQRNPVLFQYPFGFVFKQSHRILLKPKLSDFVDSHRVPLGPAAKTKIRTAHLR